MKQNSLKLHTNKKNLKIILIDGNVLPSSFEIKKEEKYKIANNHVYINIKNELPKFSSKEKQFINENTIAIIHEVEENNNVAFAEKYKSIDINKINLFHIMAVKNYKLKDITSSGSIKVCDLDSAIEFTENLFITSEQENIKKSRIKKALRKISKIRKKQPKNDEIKEEYIKELNIVYQYNFINRLNKKIELIPKEKTLFNLYRNAYMYSSCYQSVLAMFDYITAMGKMVEYYLYAKNNPGFKKDVVFTDIIGDNPPIWNNQILVNVCNNKENVLYKNIREEKFKLTEDEQILLHIYLSNILNMDITGTEITFDGLAEIFRQFRNRVEAHGIISDANVYAVWNLTQFFAKMYSIIFKIDQLECEFKQDENKAKLGYTGEPKVEVGRYITVIDNRLLFIKDKKSYIDYLTGEIKPGKEVK